MIYLITVYTHVLLLIPFVTGVKLPLVILSLSRLCGLICGICYYFIYLGFFKFGKKTKVLKVFVVTEKLKTSTLYIILDIMFLHTFSSCVYLRYHLFSLKRESISLASLPQLKKTLVILGVCLVTGVAYYHWLIFKKYGEVLLNEPSPNVNMRELYASFSREKLQLPNNTVITRLCTVGGKLFFTKLYDYTA